MSILSGHSRIYQKKNKNKPPFCENNLTFFQKLNTYLTHKHTYIFLLFLCKIPLFYTVSLSLITVYNFWMFYAFKTTFLGGTILIIMWLIPLFWLLVIVQYWISFKWNTDYVWTLVEFILVEISIHCYTKLKWLHWKLHWYLYNHHNGWENVRIVLSK